MMYIGWFLFTLATTFLTGLIVLHHDRHHLEDFEDQGKSENN
ncbi:hypothetical protein Psal006b_01908 [Piscirickettsia salmonis]|uniref:Cytochrome bd-I oxidase subunit CydX n=1 Tax=Piscirickettsia salmonis TaxID=1238 RepID=A0AAC8ZP05_PISSA|nr:hypothetical protein [Piscirickettsia salmonis]ALB22487.1 hypothetical protein KU39_1305 [Piscirickettsia salmonis]QGN98909.1 hypothetical protein Psal006b_01908 [Piscirickettsia salmonis]QGO02537.1 hypothetical protein Psal008_01926 [Piscirickettsia salmonis]QGO13208.1 hypothetical protein Psal010b_01905 [Piscirickettsia salmonis]QGO20263.1 hypothetical protein Psal013_01922 [Piscirickettsia salmonis]